MLGVSRLKPQTRIHLSHPPCDVDALEGVEACEHTGTGDTSEDVGASSLHHRHESLVLEDLCTAVEGALVLHGRARGHHHSPPVVAYSIVMSNLKHTLLI